MDLFMLPVYAKSGVGWIDNTVQKMSDMGSNADINKVPNYVLVGLGLIFIAVIVMIIMKLLWNQRKKTSQNQRDVQEAKETDSQGIVAAIWIFGIIIVAGIILGPTIFSAMT